MKKRIGLCLASLMLALSCYGIDYSLHFNRDARIYRVALGSGTAPTAADMNTIGILPGDVVVNTDDNCYYLMHATNVYTKITAAGDVSLTSMTAPLASNKVYIGNSSGNASAQTISGDITVTTGGVVAVGAAKITAAKTAIASNKIFIGNSSGVAWEQTISGDIGMTTGGVVAITGDSIVNADVNTAANIAATKIAGEALVKTTTFTGGGVTGAWNNLTVSVLPAISGANLTGLNAANLTVGSSASAINGAAITNVTGTASPNGTVLNALDISACTNLPAAGVDGTALVTTDLGSSVQDYSANLDTLALNNGNALTNITATSVIPTAVNAITNIVGSNSFVLWPVGGGAYVIKSITP